MIIFCLFLFANSIQIDYIPSFKSAPAGSSGFPLLYLKDSKSLLLLSSISSVLNTLNYFSLTSLTWESENLSSPMIPPLTRCSSYAFFNNFVYIIGGLTPTGPTSEVWALSLLSNQVKVRQWERVVYKGSFPQLYSAGFVLNDEDNPEYLLIFGGFTGKAINQQVFKFELNQLEFSVLNFEKTVALVSPLLLMNHDSFLAVGGFSVDNNDSVYSQYLLIFNLTTNTVHHQFISGQFTPRIAGGYLSNDSVIFLQGMSEQEIISKVSLISLKTFESSESFSQFSTYSYSFSSFGSGVYVFGGKEPKSTNRLVRYSDLPLKIEVLSEHFLSPPGRLYPVLTVNEEKIYLFGGFDGKNYLNDMWSLDLRLNQWNSVKFTGQVPSARQKSAFCEEGSYIFLFGGQTDEFLNDLYYFSTSALKWNPLGDSLQFRPSPRASACMIFHETKLFIYGGLTSAGNSNEIWEFDLYKEKFSKVSNSEFSLEHNQCSFEDHVMTVVSYNHSHKFIQFFNVSSLVWLKSLQINLNFYGPVNFYMSKHLVTIGGVRAQNILSQKLEVLSIENREKSENSVSFFTYFSTFVYFEHFLYIFSGYENSKLVGLSSTPSSLMIKFNISQVLNTRKCSKGTFSGFNGSQAVCKSCPPGSYSSALGAEECTSCPAGTFSKSLAATSVQQCKPCQIGSWNNMTGQASCRDCPSNGFCAFGSVVPAKEYSEFLFESSQPSGYSESKDLYKYSTEMIIFLSLGGIFVLVCIFMLSKGFRDKIHMIDIYTTKHNHKVMVPMYIKQTTLGGLCTVLFCLGALNFIIISVLKFKMVNLVETRTLVPLITIPGGMKILADLSVKVDFRFYGGKCDKSFLFTYTSGVEGSLFMNTYKKEHDCFLIISCSECHVNDNSEIFLSFREENSFASEISVNVSSTSSVANQLSSVSTHVKSNDYQVFTGTVSSEFQFELIPSLLNDQSTKSSGYHVNGNIRPIPGSQSEEIELYYTSQVSVLIRLSVASTCLNILIESETELFELFSALIGTVFGLMSSIGGILRVTEKHYDNLSSWFQHKNMLNYYRTRINKLMRIIHTDSSGISSKSTSDIISFSIYEKSFSEIEKTYLKQ